MRLAVPYIMKETELKESWCVIPPVTITTSITLLSNEHLLVDKSINMSQPTSLDLDDDKNGVVDNGIHVHHRARQL
ncbi:hypothetical protein GHT06_020545 [Daphnia sinensis]|uniref:Uncharacterized protein n=1 Tax=Daphnia sinensis TaxID=1820382 RepID=A0AAD5KHW1_9CRUS|nr:hypothetical protein GHT06_020545 [Daphnia sinensis]